MKLERSFFTRDTFSVAEEILGKTLVHITNEGVTSGKVVEVEAYLGAKDKAAHSYKDKGKPTKRTEIQYGEGGYAYVYLIYGMYICMNIVTNEKMVPEVLLIRALEPVSGIDLMKKRRNTANIKNLCNGPGKLTQAMGITMENYGEDLCGNSLYFEDAPALNKKEIVTSKRINIDYAGEAKDFMWRYCIRDNPFVSRNT